ncbi:hypothetical protein [Anaerotignum sp.]|uniref:hypothetical protein n=1 Tax=Anaerotignum sp. TaxID=2039241 RepID=UPI0028ABF299|nr:hypothetical protein [Anaerotignum sp.]
MINKSVLVQKVSERGFTTKEIAEKLKIEHEVFAKKLESCDDCFTVKEVQSLVRILGMEGAEAAKIFFG